VRQADGHRPRSRAGRQAAAAALLAPLAAAPFFLISGSASAQEGNKVSATVDNKFDPATINVKAGDEVTWTNAGGAHTVTGGENAPDPASPIGNNNLFDPNATVKVKFDKPGTYKYFCQPHLAVGMVGEVVVAEAAAGSATGTAKPTAPEASNSPGTNSAAASPTAPAGPDPRVTPRSTTRCLDALDEQRSEEEAAMAGSGSSSRCSHAASNLFLGLLFALHPLAPRDLTDRALAP
jgi:plastocyanin